MFLVLASKATTAVRPDIKLDSNSLQIVVASISSICSIVFPASLRYSTIRCANNNEILSIISMGQNVTVTMHAVSIRCLTWGVQCRKWLHPM
jgi:hypothetical protein